MEKENTGEKGKIELGPRGKGELKGGRKREAEEEKSSPRRLSVGKK